MPLTFTLSCIFFFPLILVPILLPDIGAILDELFDIPTQRVLGFQRTRNINKTRNSLIKADRPGKRRRIVFIGV